MRNLIIILIGIFCVGSLYAVPQPPSIIYGKIFGITERNNQDELITITAEVNGKERAKTFAFYDENMEHNYLLRINHDDGNDPLNIFGIPENSIVKLTANCNGTKFSVNDELLILEANSFIQQDFTLLPEPGMLIGLLAVALVIRKRQL